MEAERFVEQFIEKEERKPTSRRLMIGIAILVLLLALAATWRWTSLGGWSDIKTIIYAVQGIKNHALASLLIIGAYMVGSLIVLPVTVLVIVTVFVFGPVTGFFYSLGGMFLSALATYGIGHALGRNTIRRLAGSRLNKVSRHLARQGILTMVVGRMIPIAPFTIINLVAGASHIRFRDFAIGTLVGMTPGLLAITLIVDRIGKAVRTPSPISFGIVAGVIGVIALAVLGLRWWLLKHESSVKKSSYSKP